MQTHQNHCNF